MMDESSLYVISAASTGRQMWDVMIAILVCLTCTLVPMQARCSHSDRELGRGDAQAGGWQWGEGWG